MNRNNPYERYQRQLSLKAFGEAGQQALLQAKVLVVGAGGLGCPALQYLAAAGTGTIGIVDDDSIAISNLHRQVLYATADAGLPKAERAAFVLKKLNPDIGIISYNERMTTANALEIISGYDVVIDGTDNFPSRYLINDACVLLDKPLVYGSVSGFEGQVAIFNGKQSNGDKAANYRDLFPQPPREGEVPNCAEAGVMGTLTGITGTMMANETIKLITGTGQPLINRLLIYNSLNNLTYEISITPKETTSLLIPVSREAFKQTRYEPVCHVSSTVSEIDALQFGEMIGAGGFTIIDVRESGETPAVTGFPHRQVPLSQLKKDPGMIKDSAVILFCQSGKRSREAAELLALQSGFVKKIFSLKGGITEWKQFCEKNALT
jgi:adenylyltransferase/sulfurtransferase